MHAVHRVWYIISCSCLVIKVAVLNGDLAFTAFTCSDSGSCMCNACVMRFLGAEAASQPSFMSLLNITFPPCIIFLNLIDFMKFPATFMFHKDFKCSWYTFFFFFFACLLIVFNIFEPIKKPTAQLFLVVITQCGFLQKFVLFGHLIDSSSHKSVTSLSLFLFYLYMSHTPGQMPNLILYI